MTNPFWCEDKGPLTPMQPTYVRRTGFVNKVISRLRDGQYVQIIGPHQSGRSTAAHQIAEHCVSHKDLRFMPALILSYGLRAVNSVAFADTLMSRIGEVSDTFLGERMGSKVKAELHIGTTNVWYDLYRALVRAGEKLDGQDYGAFVLVFDELEMVLDDTVCDVLSFLRGLYMHYARRRELAPYRTVILATRDMQRWDLRNRSPFNISSALPMPAFTPEEFAVMLNADQTREALDTVSFSDSARETVFRESGGSPYFIQKLCYTMVENLRVGRTSPTLSHSDALRACIWLFEEGDESIKRLNHDLETGRAPQEWDLCRKLACGMKIPYRGVQTEIDRLAELGVVGDERGFCHIPVGLYRRRIVNRCYNERYSQLDYEFNDRERVLLSLSAIEAILLNIPIRSDIVEKLGLGSDDALPRGAESYAQSIAGLLKELHDKKGWDLDLQEVNVFLEYYRERRAIDLDEITGLLAKWFAMVLPGQGNRGQPPIY